MKNLKLSLVAAALIPIFVLAETNIINPVPLIAGGGTVTPESIVGDVLVSNDDADMTVTYKISDALAYDPNALNAENDGKWCITETHTHAGDNLSDFPLNKSGSPKIGRFDEKYEGECIPLVEQILPIPSYIFDEFESDITIGAHAVVKQFNAVPDHLLKSEGGIVLPMQVTLEIYPGEETYLQAEITNSQNEPGLDGFYPHSWCIDPNHSIHPYTSYPGVWAVSSYDERFLSYPTGSEYDEYIGEHIKNPHKLPMVNYIINKFHDDGYPEGTHKCSIQQALWQITNDERAACSGYEEDQVVAIVSDAEANGVDYRPGCDDIMAIVLLGDPADPVQTLLQTTIVHIPVPCEGSWSEETAWGGLYEGTTTINRFVDNNWAMWFDYDVSY